MLILLCYYRLSQSTVEQIMGILVHFPDDIKADDILDSILQVFYCAYYISYYLIQIKLSTVKFETVRQQFLSHGVIGVSTTKLVTNPNNILHITTTMTPPVQTPSPGNTIEPPSCHIS